MEHEREPEAKKEKRHLQKLFEEVERTVKPYPPIDDVHVDFSWSHETSKGKVAKTLSYTTAALLAGMTIYGMVIHDREILIAVLEVIRYSVVALLTWALGSKVITSLLPRSRDHDETHEENQNSGRKEDPPDS